MTDKPPKAGKVTPPPATAEKKIPPKASGSKASTAKPKAKAKPQGRPRQLETRLEDFIVGVAMAVQLTGDAFSANVIQQGAKPLAEAWGALAQEDARVRRILEKMMTGGAWGQVITAHLALVLPILMHKGVLPQSLPNPFGIVDMNEAVEAELRMQEMKRQAQANRRGPQSNGSDSGS